MFLELLSDLRSQNYRRLFILIFLALIAILPRVPWLALPLENDSGANAFIARHLLQGERLYDRFHTAHHLPGIYYTFEVAFKIFGDSAASPKLLLFGFIIITCWLIYWIGLEIANEMTGVLGAVFYALVSSQELFSGTTAAMEHFANLPLTATILFFLYLLKKKTSTFSFIWVGILAAISILYKIVYVAPIVSTTITLIIWEWTTRKQARNRYTVFAQVSAITAGFLLPLIIMTEYYFSQGLWDRFILVFKLGFSYFASDEVSTLGFPRPFGFPLFITGVNNLALLAFGLMGMYRMTRASFPIQHIKNIYFLTISLWCLLSFASTGIRGGGYEHYVLIILPPLTLSAGYEIESARNRFQKSLSEKQARISASVMTSFIIIFFVFANFKLYSQYFQYTVGAQTDEFNPFWSTTLQEQVKYIQAQTKPDDYIYLWGNNVQFYYYTDRLPPIDILWPDYVAATGSPERILEKRTKYIILEDFPPTPAWLQEGLIQNYSLETTIAGWKFYKRNEN